MTKKEAEKHLAHLARRRARYAERKKQIDLEKPLISIVSGVGKPALVFTDCPEASPEVAPTPREPEQMALPFQNRIAQLRPMTPEAQIEIEREIRHQRNLAWIREIIARLGEKS